MSFRTIHAFASAPLRHRLRVALSVFVVLAVLAPQLAVAKASVPLIHVDASHAAQPVYRKALLKLFSESGDPLNVKELQQLKGLPD